MKVIAFIGQKGGSGKTTLAVTLATEATRQATSAVIVDLDPQATAAKWGDRREAESPRVISAQAERLEQTLDSVRRTTDIAVIDTAGKADRELLIAARLADLVILPIRPTISDMETLEATIDIMRLAKVQNCWTVLNAIVARDPRVAQATEFITDKGLRVAPIQLGQRVIYADAMIAGVGAAELDPASKAAEESARFYAWVMETVK